MLRSTLDRFIDTRLYPCLQNDSGYRAPVLSGRQRTGTVNGVPCLVVSPTTTSPRRIAVYCHGNATTLDVLAQSNLLKDMADRLNIELWAPEYSPVTEYATGRNIDALQYQQVQRFIQGLPGDQQILLVGRSLGVAIALGAIARQHDINKRIEAVHLISPFSKLDDIIPRWVGYWGMHTTGRFDNMDHLRQLRQDLPVHVYHGTHDELIPAQHAANLVRTRHRATWPATITTLDYIAGMGHDPTEHRMALLDCMYKRCAA